MPIPSSPLAEPSQPIDPPSNQFQMELNSSELLKTFPNHSTFEPCSDPGLIDAPTLVQDLLPFSSLTNIIPPTDITYENLFSAFSNPTAGLLTCWHFSGSTAKTKEETNRLWTYLQDPAFNPSRELPFLLDCECSLIKRYLQDESNPF
ncbi:hypothetical protein J3R82DRAFT_10192 [Butyriboletus roseoflavus]|nr:hypothetical protein J3R82DRAFT_10192 [Butyriboletus roseoflavus]